MELDMRSHFSVDSHIVGHGKQSVTQHVVGTVFNFIAVGIVAGLFIQFDEGTVVIVFGQLVVHVGRVHVFDSDDDNKFDGSVDNVFDAGVDNVIDTSDDDVKHAGTVIVTASDDIFDSDDDNKFDGSDDNVFDATLQHVGHWIIVNGIMVLYHGCHGHQVQR